MYANPTFSRFGDMAVRMRPAGHPAVHPPFQSSFQSHLVEGEQARSTPLTSGCAVPLCLIRGNDGDLLFGTVGTNKLHSIDGLANHQPCSVAASLPVWCMSRYCQSVVVVGLTKLDR